MASLSACFQSSSKTKTKTKTKDSALLALANKLKEAEHLLDVLVDDYSDYQRTKRAKLSDILSYAHKISYTTFAPPEFGAGMGPLKGALPPAPQEEQMRASQLYNFADLDVGLPKMIVEDPLAEMIPPNVVIPPVELPSDLPILPPAGWKPGDPISLPPSDAVPEELQMRPGRMPVPIQVRHVQIDIEDDDSSDNSSSSDWASSDSED